MTSLMSLLIIRERPQLMEQMFHKMYNKGTDWTQHLKSELYDKKEELNQATKAVEYWKAKHDNLVNKRIRKFDKNEQKLENRIADITNQIDQLGKLKKYLKDSRDSLRKTRNEIFYFKELLMKISTSCPETFTIIQTYLDKLPSLNDDFSLDKNIFEKGIEKFRNIFKKKKE
jgi:DNA repair exonuclease SbcCD ATPase subunit